jgi:SM-20-related protein
LRDALFADGFGVQDRFISARRVRGLIACASRRRSLREFAAARVGAGRELGHREEIRGDLTCWLAEPLFPEERSLTRDLDELRLQLNRDGFLGLQELEMHYAWYPPGAGYAPHVDQLRGQDQRVVSLILYLNEAWHPGAGGELRLFGAAAEFKDIEPMGGRLVCFVTAGREHAVLPTHQGRLSLSGWFRRR